MVELMSARQSQHVSNLFEALAKVQEQIDNVSQDREVEVPIKDKQTGGYKGKYKFRYATMPGILTHIRQAMNGNALWYAQRVEAGHMVTRLFHKSGEWMDAGDLPLPDIKGGPQDAGSIFSYWKRYSLTAALGLAAEDDEDAKDAEHHTRELDVRARGAAQAQATTQGEVEEPPMGWGDWTRGLMGVLRDKDTLEEVDALQEANVSYIRALAKVDKAMWRDLRDAFDGRRAALDPKRAF
jgi:hypothetical protein